MSVKYILFDMDGLLTDSENLSFKIIGEILEKQGEKISFAQYQQLIGKNNDDGSKLLSSMFENVDGKALLATYGVSFEQAVEQGRLKAKKGVIEILDECDRLGIKKAIASSNNGKHVNLSLSVLGIVDRFDVLVYDGMVAKAKPAPDLFLKAAELLGAPLLDCLVLEDSLAGVQAAGAAGIPVIVVPDMIKPNEEILSIAIKCADSLLDVIEYIKENH